MVPGQAQMLLEEERALDTPILSDIPNTALGEENESRRMLPSREDAFISEIEGTDVEPDLRDELKAFVRGNYGGLAYHLYPNLKDKVDDPKLRALIMGELTLKDKHKINVIMLEKVSGLKDPVLAERLKTYVTVEKAHKAALSDAADDYKKLEKSALKDPLTGLWNRGVFDESIEAVVDRVTRNQAAMENARQAKDIEKIREEGEKGRSAFLVMIDIDHFKQVNDTYGHQGGDYVLKELASLLMGSGRKSEKPFRYGGEEFAIIADGFSYDEMVVMADRIRKKVEGHNFMYDGQKINVTISLGVAGLDDLGEGADAILNNLAVKSPVERFTRLADAALYHAKD